MIETTYWYKTYRDMLNVYRTIRGFIMGHKLEGTVTAIGIKGKFLVIVLLDDNLNDEDKEHLVTYLRASDGNPYDLREPSVLRGMREFKRRTATHGQHWTEYQYSPGLWIKL